MSNNTDSYWINWIENIEKAKHPVENGVHQRLEKFPGNNFLGREDLLCSLCGFAELSGDDGS